MPHEKGTAKLITRLHEHIDRRDIKQRKKEKKAGRVKESITHITDQRKAQPDFKMLHLSRHLGYLTTAETIQSTAVYSTLLIPH